MAFDACVEEWCLISLIAQIESMDNGVITWRWRRQEFMQHGHGAKKRRDMYHCHSTIIPCRQISMIRQKKRTCGRMITGTCTHQRCPLMAKENRMIVPERESEKKIYLSTVWMMWWSPSVAERKCCINRMLPVVTARWKEFRPVLSCRYISAPCDRSICTIYVSSGNDPNLLFSLVTGRYVSLLRRPNRQQCEVVWRDSHWLHWFEHRLEVAVEWLEHCLTRQRDAMLAIVSTAQVDRVESLKDNRRALSASYEDV